MKPENLPTRSAPIPRRKPPVQQLAPFDDADPSEVDAFIKMIPDLRNQRPAVSFPRYYGPMVAVIDAIPLLKDEHGVYRVGGTRVSLDLVIYAFDDGATAEEIAKKFPTLALSDVYQVIGYYLKNRAGLAEYFSAREREQQTLLAHHPERSPAGLRDRLMARRKHA